MNPFFENPDEVIQIADDAMAQRVLLELGLLTKFSAGAADGKEWADLVTYADHPTHWIVALRFTGFPNASDNGFSVLCYPKRSFSLSKANECLEALKRQFFPQGVEGRFRPSQVGQN